jgi:hypothetical protein
MNYATYLLLASDVFHSALEHIYLPFDKDCSRKQEFDD